MAIAVCPSICGKANKLIDLSKDITGADKWQLVKIIVIIIIILIPLKLLEDFENFLAILKPCVVGLTSLFMTLSVEKKNVN